jgi:signal transduction histidine kinase
MTEKPCILIVDNDAGLRETLSHILKAKGYIPVTAATGKQALAMVEKHMPDVALTDFKLKDISGIDIIRKVKDKSGKITNFVSIDRDRTHEIELEKQLFQAQKMETIGTLAGGIAHDFNNILTSVIGFSELALNDAKKGSQQYDNLQEVLTAGNRAVDLVKQILTFSRQTDQKKKPVQVKQILKEALKFIRSSIPTTINIKQNIQSDALIMGDPAHIHQVLMNLCANAAHAMKDTGGVLTVDLSDMEFNSNVVSNYPDLPPGKYLNLTVTDTGHGMTPDVLDKIFDPFFTTKQKEEGTGMGLSVVHGIVRGHEGAIYAYSNPGQGSTFNIFLPAIHKQLQPEDSVDRPVLTGTERILMVDDEPAIVKMSKQTLESLGYDVVTRTSSIEALEFFRRRPKSVDLVITDMTMPNMTGDELAVELMKIRPDIPVILCTGFSTRINEQKSKAKGIRAFVLKPIIKQKLSETIRKVLDR